MGGLGAVRHATGNRLRWDAALQHAVGGGWLCYNQLQIVTIQLAFSH
jgi:hypothetical protein